ncbi:hypothetical protein ACFWIB_40980 [Streptomyces sp. NPDC127051]
MVITNLIQAAQEGLLQLRGAHRGLTADAARILLGQLSHSIEVPGRDVRG